MIHHISIAARETQRAASVLAEIVGGQVIPAPQPFPKNSWFVLTGDEHGTLIEIVPAGTEMVPGDGEVSFIGAGPAAEYSPFHAFISVAASADHILRIGEREGWKTRICDRGGFELVEFWIENRQMIELATPEMTAQYLALLTNPEAIQALLAAQ